MYVTGDIHGNIDSILYTINNTPGSTVLVAGDLGIGFFNRKLRCDDAYFDFISKCLSQNSSLLLFCDGNHENFDVLNSYEISEWNGGKVHKIRNNIIHLMRGEIYDIDSERYFVFGGGFSLDYEYREIHKTWWPEEMPDDSEYENARQNLSANNHIVDYVITHSAPYETVEYLSHIGTGVHNDVNGELKLTSFLSWVASTTYYHKWYFGHFHVDRELWKNQYALYEAVRDCKTGKIDFYNEKE